MEPDENEAEPGSAAIDVGFAIFLIALALVALFWLIPAGVSTRVRGNDITPAFMPRLSAMAVIALSLAMIVHRLLRETLTAPGRAARNLVGDTVVMSAAAILVMLGLSHLGFVVTAMAIVLVGGLVARHRPRWWLVLLAVLFAPAVNVAVWRLFLVDLPTGLLG